MAVEPYIANTDKAWFDFLYGISDRGRIDEVNFWRPLATKPLRRMAAGEPLFFRLKKPDYAVVGYGFFAHFTVLRLQEAWQVFAAKNGDPDEVRFLERIAAYRGLDVGQLLQQDQPLGCVVLRDAMFWGRERWIPWTAEQGFHKNIPPGRTERDPVRISRLMAEIEYDRLGPPEEFAPEFEPLEVDERDLILARSRERIGQGSFRLRLLDAYSRCAITGERTEPVLEAAHVQPYLGPRSNHIQNGLLLSQEFHTLFDRGLVTITPEYRVRVSPRIRERWNNGRRYYEFQERPLVQLPEDPSCRPSQRALTWHNRRIFQG